MFGDTARMRIACLLHYVAYNIGESESHHCSQLATTHLPTILLLKSKLQLSQILDTKKVKCPAIQKTYFSIRQKATF